MEISITLNIRAPLIEQHLAELVAVLADADRLKALSEKLAESRESLTSVLPPKE